RCPRRSRTWSPSTLWAWSTAARSGARTCGGSSPKRAAYPCASANCGLSLELAAALRDRLVEDRFPLSRSGFGPAGCSLRLARGHVRLLLGRGSALLGGGRALGQIVDLLAQCFDVAARRARAETESQCHQQSEAHAPAHRTLLSPFVVRCAFDVRYQALVARALGHCMSRFSS